MLGLRKPRGPFVILLTGSLFLVSCQTVYTFANLPSTTGAETEECLIDVSKKLMGHTLSDGPLLTDLDAARFFRTLDPDYPDKTCFWTVQAYPVKGVQKDDSYVLFPCDKQRRWVLYEDWGTTVDRVDHPYVRE